MDRPRGGTHSHHPIRGGEKPETGKPQRKLPREAHSIAWEQKYQGRDFILEASTDFFLLKRGEDMDWDRQSLLTLTMEGPTASGPWEPGAYLTSNPEPRELALISLKRWGPRNIHQSGRSVLKAQHIGGEGTGARKHRAQSSRWTLTFPSPRPGQEGPGIRRTATPRITAQQSRPPSNPLPRAACKKKTK